MTMSASRIVYVVDDDDAVRDSVAMLLEGAGYEIHTFASGAAFLEVADAAQPGCVLLDMRMPQMNGLEVQEALTRRGFSLPVIVLTGESDIGIAVRAMKGGAFEFLEKPYDGEALLACLEDAFHHLEATSEEAAKTQAARALVASLTHRELEVLQGLLGGLPNKLIAYQLGISIRTVEIYRANVMDKLQARSLSTAIRIALAVGVEPLAE
jgi:two-component system response regulator FixJ